MASNLLDQAAVSLIFGASYVRRRSVWKLHTMNKRGTRKAAYESISQNGRQSWHLPDLSPQEWELVQTRIYSWSWKLLTFYTQPDTCLKLKTHTYKQFCVEAFWVVWRKKHYVCLAEGLSCCSRKVYADIFLVHMRWLISSQPVTHLDRSC